MKKSCSYNNNINSVSRCTDDRLVTSNRSFSSYLLPSRQTHFHIHLKILHKDSFWNRGPRQLSVMYRLLLADYPLNCIPLDTVTISNHQTQRVTGLKFVMILIIDAFRENLVWRWTWVFANIYQRVLLHQLLPLIYVFQGGAVASWLVRSTPERAVRVPALAVFFGKTLYSHNSSLHPRV